MVVSTTKKPKPRTHMTPADLAHEAALALVEEQFRDYDVVWAKVGSFPWWPAVVFHSWDLVRGLGLPTEEKKLAIPEPRRVPVLDAGGAETGYFRVVHHCLVMFVDQFNFSVVEMEPKSIVSYVAYFDRNRDAVLNSKPGSKVAKYKKRFKEALAKAEGLLHLGAMHKPEDVALLEKPKKVDKPAKKRRTEPVSQLPPPSPLEDESFDDAWDDCETDEKEQEEAGDDDDDAYELPSAKRSRRAKKTSDSESSEAPSRKRNGVAVRGTKEADRGGGSLKGKGIVKRPVKASGSASKRKPSKKASNTADDSDEFEAPRPLKAQRKKNAHTQKSPENDSIDLTGTPESATKQRKGSAKAKAKRIKQLAVDVSSEEPSSSAQGKKKPRGKKKNSADMEVADLTELADDEGESSAQESTSEPAQAVVMTPLSSIWTTKADTPQNSSAASGLAYKQDFVWDTSVFSDNDVVAEELTAGDDSSESTKQTAGDSGSNGRERALGKRQPRSVQQAQIRQNLMFGNLDPHTMVQCESYRLAGEEENTRSRGPGSIPPPFTVIVHPDATFVCDLHAHLATCEIIGFLGGKWDEAINTLYIQAAFPCRSLMIDGDDGSTDVEMDPGSEIELRGIINDAELEVVGWYHSHPAFAPDPSIRDIENQASYQQLFKRTQMLSGSSNGKANVAEPFVGLIVSTYDTRRDTPVSLFRYFHVRGEKVSGGARREIYMPYEFIPARRHYRSVLNDEANEKIRALPAYPSVLKALNMPQRFRPASSLISMPPTDDKSQVQAVTTVKASPTRRKSVGGVRKRKQSADIGATEAPVKRGRRGRKKRSVGMPDASSQIDLTMDDVEEVTARDDVSASIAAVDVIDVSGNDPIESGDGDIKMKDASESTTTQVVQTASITSESGAVTAADAAGSNGGDEEAGSIQTTSNVRDLPASVDQDDMPVKSESDVKASSDRAPVSLKQEAAASSFRISDNGTIPVETSTTNPSSSVGDAHQTTEAATVKDGRRETTDSLSSASQTSSLSLSDNVMKGADLVDAPPADAPIQRKPAPTVVIDAATEGSNHLSAGVSPSSVASNGSSGRRRNRKPAHTNKNPWRAERSPKSNNSQNESTFGYFTALQSMDPHFSRNGTRDDATPKVEEDVEKSKVKPVQLGLPLKDPKYFFIGEADVKATSGDKKTTVADASVTDAATTSVVGKPSPSPADLTGNCSTDDEIELVAVDEGSEPPEKTTTIVDQAAKTASTVHATESVAGASHQSQTMMYTHTKDTAGAGDEIAVVRARLDELVKAVVSDSEVSDQQVVKLEGAVTSGTPPEYGDKDAAVESATVDESEPVCATPALEPQKSSVEAAECDRGATDEDLINIIAVEAVTDATTAVSPEVQAKLEPAVEAPLAPQPLVHPESTPTPVNIKSESGAIEQASEAVGDDTTIKTEAIEPVLEDAVTPAIVKKEKPLLFGRGRQHEDIRTSLEKMDEIMKRMQSTGVPAVKSSTVSGVPSGASASPDVTKTEAEADATVPSAEDVKDPRTATVERLEAHLTSLRTRYGPGMFGCVEQVVTLVDYYRDFERRIDLSEPWKAKMNKLRKIEASLSEYVQYLNLSAALRRAFVEDLVGYLELSWRLTQHER